MFGSLFEELDEESIIGQHFRQMRYVNNMMSSFLGDPFGMLNSNIEAVTGQSSLTGSSFGTLGRNMMTPFGFGNVSPLTRLWPTNSPMSGSSFSSSSFMSMTQGPDGRPQVYKTTSSVQTGPDGLRETQKTLQDSRSGIKKMAIGHHIGDRAHVVEREQNVKTGHHEERQDFLNLDEDEAEDFNKEYMEKRCPLIADSGTLSSQTESPRMLMQHCSVQPRRQSSTISTISRPIGPVTTARRFVRPSQSSPLTLSSESPSLSIHSHPYRAAVRRSHRPMKSIELPQLEPISTGVPYCGESQATKDRHI